MLKKKDFTGQVVSAIGNRGYKITNAMVDAFLTAVLDVIRDDAFETGETKLPGLCSVKRKTRKARRCRNPRTGEMIETPERDYYAIKLNSGFIA